MNKIYEYFLKDSNAYYNQTHYSEYTYYLPKSMIILTLITDNLNNTGIIIQKFNQCFAFGWK